MSKLEDDISIYLTYCLLAKLDKLIEDEILEGFISLLISEGYTNKVKTFWGIHIRFSSLYILTTTVPLNLDI